MAKPRLVAGAAHGADPLPASGRTEGPPQAVRPAARRPPADGPGPAKLPPRLLLPAAPRVKVAVWLDAAALADLELLVHYRHGPRSRSAIVREAIDWLRAKEAAWLLRARAQRERIDREAAELEAARTTPRAQRDQASRDELVAEAVLIARETA